MRKAKLAATRAKRAAKKQQQLLPDEDQVQEERGETPTAVVAAESAPVQTVARDEIPDVAAAAASPAGPHASFGDLAGQVGTNGEHNSPPEATAPAEIAGPVLVVSLSSPPPHREVPVAPGAVSDVLVTRTRVPREPSNLTGRLRTFSLTYAHPPGHIFCRHWPLLKLQIVVEMIEDDVTDFLQPEDDDLTHCVQKVALEVDDAGIAVTTFTVTTNVKRATVAEQLQHHANSADPSLPFPRLCHFIRCSLPTFDGLSHETRFGRRDLVRVIQNKMNDLGPLSKLNENFPSVEALVHEYHGKEDDLLREMGCDNDELFISSSQKSKKSEPSEGEAHHAADNDGPVQSGSGQFFDGLPAQPQHTLVFSSDAQQQTPLVSDGSSSPAPTRSIAAADDVDDDVAISEVTASPESVVPMRNAPRNATDNPSDASPEQHHQHFLISDDAIPWTLPDGQANLDRDDINYRRSDVSTKWNGPALSSASVMTLLCQAYADVAHYSEDDFANLVPSAVSGAMKRESAKTEQDENLVNQRTPASASKNGRESIAASAAATFSSVASSASPQLTTPQSKDIPNSAEDGAAGGSQLNRQASFSMLVEQRLQQSGDKYAFLASPSRAGLPQDGAAAGGSTSRRSSSARRGPPSPQSSAAASPSTASMEELRVMHRLRNIQRLCYASVRSGVIQLNPSSRNKIAVCKGTLKGQEVTLSVEWDLLLVLKSSNGTFGGKRILLVHPLPARTDVFIDATNTPVLDDMTVVAGGASTGKELVLVVEPPFLEDELHDDGDEDQASSSKTVPTGAAASAQDDEPDYRTAASMLKRSRARTYTLRVHGGYEALCSARDTILRCRKIALGKMAQPPQGPQGASPV